MNTRCRTIRISSFRREVGQSIVLLAMMMLGMLAAVGLAIDGGILWYNLSLLDSRADAAALAGGEELIRADVARTKAEQYLYLNGIVDESRGGDTRVEINFGKRAVDNDVIVVDLYKDQQLAFLPVIGIRSVELHAHAAVFATSWASDQTWSMFRGGCGRTGYQEGSWTNTYNQAAQGDFELGYFWGFRWALNGDVHHHRSTPAIGIHPGIEHGQPVAYVGTNGPDPKNQPGVGGGVMAFNTVVSNTIWFANLGTMVRSSPYFLNDPAITQVANEGYPMIIVAGHNGHEYALDARDGSIVWETSGISSDYYENDNQKYRSSPTYSCGPITINGVTYDGVIFNATYGGNIYAYDAKTGTILWRSTPLPSLSQSWVTTNNDSLAISRERNRGPIYATANYVKDADFTAAGYSQGVVFVATFGIKAGGQGNGVWIWDQGDKNTPLDYTFGPTERDVQREIQMGVQKNLTFEFKNNASTNPGDYNIQVWFEGCGGDVLTLPPADNSACGGAITSTLTLSFDKKKVLLPIYQMSDPTPHRISRIWINWPDGSNKDLKVIYFDDSTTGAYVNSPYIYAINAANGEGVWFDVLDDYANPSNPSDRNSNAIAKIDTDRDGTPDQWRIFANPTDPYLYAYNAVTGQRLWRAHTGAGNHRSDMAIYRNVVFGGNDEGVYAIDAVCGYSTWDNVAVQNGDVVNGVVCTNSADQVNPHFNDTAPDGSRAFKTNTNGARYIPGGVKSAPAVVDGIVMVGANQSSLGATNAGSMWGLWWENGRDLGHYDTNTYDGPGPYTGGAQNGDVRSGVVVGPDSSVYFGAQDGALYQLYVTRRLVLIE